MAKHLFLATLTLLLMAATATAQNRAPVNMGFEETSLMDPLKPAGWYGGGDGFVVEIDTATAYEGRNSLRMETIAEGGTGFALASQSVPSSFAGGRRVRYSGYIKTEDVANGYAGLWMRVDGVNGMIYLDNMQGPLGGGTITGPDGTTPWTRYEIEIPVAPNAQRIIFGALKPGTGTAWFDALAIEVDEQSTVEAAPGQETTPKPDYAGWLQSDDELATPADSNAPTESEAVVDWVRANHHPIRSLLTDEFDDLHFLKPILEGKRIVQLGESGHGMAEFNMAKVRLIKFLHQELSYDVIAFESSIYECNRANERAAEDRPEITMRSCIFGVWHTEEVVPLFEYLKETHSTDRPLLLTGFDVQESSGMGKQNRPDFFRDVVAVLDTAYARQVYDFDKAFIERPSESRESSMAFFAENKDRLIAGYDSLAQYISRHEDELAQAFAEDPKTPLLARQAAWSLIQYVRQNTAPNFTERSEIRDEGMADNLDFLLNKYYPDKKIIVWGHNYHIRHANDAVDPSPSRTMGGWVAERHRDALYTVGLYTYRGSAAMNNRQVYHVTQASRGSLESILYQVRKKYFFVDLSQQEKHPGTAWMFDQITTKTWGTRDVRMVLRDQYDGILFVDTVTPPDYLPR